jgi:anti-sigma factor ChrR (cupin superfamily)
MTRKPAVSRRRAIQMAAGLAGLEPWLARRVLAGSEMPPATLRRLKEMTWQPLQSDFFPPGLKVKALFADKAKNTSLSVVRYPKGYHEPRHYHKGCGHWIYYLTGKITDPTQAYTPGTFSYAPPLNVHGPFTAEQESDVLFFVDGPFDVFGT